MTRNKLSSYRAKRNFGKTAEPTGKAKVKPAEHLRYVIQKHAARRLHYDFRLELDGVFKSWAVTRGPSLDSRDKRLAVEVEDHPLDYGDFEGTIPKGQYGGGTVMLWDRGFWAPEGSKPPAEALRAGELRFVLAGEKLRGGWVLVRMARDRNRGKRTNWLLIKHRDADARPGGTEALLAEDRSVASGRSMAEIAAGKKPGPKPFMLASGKAAAANAVWQSDRSEDAADGDGRKAQSRPLREEIAAAGRSDMAREGRGRVQIPDFVPPKLCRLVDRPPSGKAWAHEIKFDGYRVQLRVQNERVTVKTRKGLNWTPKFPSLAKAARDLPDCLIDGEIVALDENGVPDFASLQAALSEKADGDLIFFAFDLLFANGRDLRPLPLSERKAALRSLLDNVQSRAMPIRYVEHFETGGDAILKSACRMSLEGIVSKRLDAPYRSGRGDAWTKAKCRAGHEVVIGGWTGQATHLRSLLVGVHRGKHLVYIGRVGTGFGTARAKDILTRLKAVASRKSPFGGVGAPRKEPNVHWVKPQLVAEIEFAGWTESGMVRQAAFKGLREDKPAEDVEAERPEAGGGDVVQPGLGQRPRRASASARSRAALVMGVAISNPDKALWPEAGHEARSRALLRGGRPLDDPSFAGAAVLHRSRARRHRRREVFPAPRHAKDVEPPGACDRLRGSQALPANRPGRRPDRRCTDRRAGTPPLELRAGASRQAGAPRLRPRSRARRALRPGRRGCAGVARAAGGIRPCRLLQDDRWQGLARDGTSGAAEEELDDLAGSQGVCRRGVPTDGGRQPRPLCGEHGQVAPSRSHLPRLSAQ